MADDEINPLGTPTTNYGWIKPTVGGDDDAWGGLLNTDLDGIDSTVHGIQTSVPAASSTTPAMDGTAAVGTAATFARADHVHPVDTSRYAATNPSGYQTAAQVTTSLGPYALIASPTFTGVPAAPTPAPGTNTTQLATTAFVSALPAAMNDNRIINGDMRIDQRNASAGGTATNVYTCDRWQFIATQTAKFTWQRVSTLPAPGFPYCWGCTSQSAYALAAGDTFYVGQSIEADAVSDLAFGAAGAQPVTLSFLALSNQTGTFGGALNSGGGSSGRSYPFTYSIPVANIWTKIVITIPGDTAGTWTMKGNATGLIVIFDLGSGATFRAPAGAWATGNFIGANGAVSVVATNGASINLTGVKLEIGSVATPFNRQSLAKSTADCQRYYEVCNAGWVGDATSGSSYYATVPFAVEKRASPTVTSISQGGAANGGFNTRASSVSALPTRTAVWGGAVSAATGASKGFVDTFSASAEL